MHILNSARPTSALKNSEPVIEILIEKFKENIAAQTSEINSYATKAL